ncbi:guanine nucleotide-binding protein alpha-4 subunit-related [Anaeramoeba flamelloides]|uniref:Guanine nucleotide-binding protein alpha-4 subunit-related n=1 Tax=Anaeramoeba flamelloides TaxID=1746091 RepID=A0AAV7ZXH1_9EUKA|nr:guanine nucleotide-binding protein alpha-4 subunit-related [Anaeramoeba flamelloides]KAJ6241523.1 guanine nucleotide-binding protein alpha-4 subunit-related [Anaeramoeba flamelloides]
MGCLCTKKKEKSELKEKIINDNIDEDFDRIKKKLAQDVKILLLGGGESGKSTIFKQMRLIRDGEFSDEEIDQFRKLIRKKCITQMQILIKASTKLVIPLKKTDEAEELLKFKPTTTIWEEEIGNLIHELWNDPGIQKTYEEKDKKFHLDDSANFFFDEIERISSDYYVPQNEDILRARTKTVSIVEEELIVNGFKFTLIDVGGQRSERRKWIHSFDDVTSVIFVTSLIGYDQTLREDHSVNRMLESLNLFRELFTRSWFKKSSIILFLNKKDLFQEKIKKLDLNVCFPEYTGGKNYEQALEYIQNQFTEVSSFGGNENRKLYPFATNAIDTSNIELVMIGVLDTILRKNFQTLY